MTVHLYSWDQVQGRTDIVPTYQDIKKAMEIGKCYRITSYSVEVKSVDLTDGSSINEKRINFSFKGHNCRELMYQCPEYFFMEQRGKFSYLRTDRPSYTGKIFNLRCIVQIDDIKAPSENIQNNGCY